MPSEVDLRQSTPPAPPGSALTFMVQQQDGKDHGDEPGTPVRKPSALFDENKQTREQLRAIHDELDKLRQRREELELRRKQLLAASIPPRPLRSRQGSESARASDDAALDVAGRLAQYASAQPSSIQLGQSSYMQPTSSSRLHKDGVPRGRRSSLGAPSSRASSCGPQGRAQGGERSAYASSTNAVSASRIPSEAERRRQLKETPYLIVKEGMRESAKQDSVLVMGSFLLDDQSKVYTFGRERRFMPVVGQRGSYYLATDTVLQQDEARMASSRKDLATYPDVSGTPGPGTYTPRYSKVSKPSPLTYLH